MTDYESILPYMGFKKAAKDCLAALSERYPFGLWYLSRTTHVDMNPLYVSTDNENFDMKDEKKLEWVNSVIYQITANQCPIIGCDTEQVVEYKSLSLPGKYNISSYVAIPLMTSSKSYFGTLCALDIKPQDEDFLKEENYLVNIARLLMSVYDLELKLSEKSREFEEVKLAVELDPLTKLNNKQGWQWILEIEEERCKRYGTPCSVMLIALNDYESMTEKKGFSAAEEMALDVANIIKSKIRKYDIGARLEPNLLGIFFYDTDANNTEVCVSRLTEALSQEEINYAWGVAQREPAYDFQYMLEEANESLKEHLSG